MYEIKSDTAKHQVTFRATGTIRLEEMDAALTEYRRATDHFGGRPHFLLADMRGLSPLAPDVAKLMGDAIGYGRSHGVVLCAHLSDSGTMRLQSRRLAREAAPNDKVTVDVVSVEEAQRLFIERASELKPKR